MIEAVKLWNEPNNQSHWDFHADPRWERFCAMAGGAARRVKALAPDLPVVVGGGWPRDPPGRRRGPLQHRDELRLREPLPLHRALLRRTGGVRCPTYLLDPLPGSTSA